MGGRPGRGWVGILGEVEGGSYRPVVERLKGETESV